MRISIIIVWYMKHYSLRSWDLLLFVHSPVYFLHQKKMDRCKKNKNKKNKTLKKATATVFKCSFLKWSYLLFQKSEMLPFSVSLVTYLHLFTCSLSWCALKMLKEKKKLIFEALCFNFLSTSFDCWADDLQFLYSGLESTSICIINL